MLALDSTIGCIEATEPDILALYRSAPITTAGADDAKHETREAFVCAIRKKTRAHVYVALVVDNKRIFVYTKPGEPDTESDYNGTLQEALGFARSMGFSPERVDLNYSAAMREVVVRNLKILRPPGSKVKALLRHGVADAPTLGNAKKQAAAKRHSPPAPPTASVASTVESPVKSTAPPTIVLPTASPVALVVAPPATSNTTTASSPLAVLAAAGGPDQSSGENEELAALREALSRMADENNALQKRVAKEQASLQEKLTRALSDSEQVKKQLATLKAEFANDLTAREEAYTEALSQVKNDLEIISAARNDQSVKLQELSALHRSTAAQLAAAGEERSKLSSEKDALALRLEALAATSPDLAALQRETAVLSGQRDEANRRDMKHTAESAARAEALTAAHEEIASLTLGRDAARQRAELLAADNGTSAAERKALQPQIEKLGIERDAALQRAELVAAENVSSTAKSAAERKALQAEIKKLGAARDAAQQRAELVAVENEASLAEREALQGEIATLAAQREEALLRAEGLERQQTVRTAEVETLRAEVAALIAERKITQEQGEGLNFSGQTRAAEAAGETRTRCAEPAKRFQLQGSESHAESRRTVQGFTSPPAAESLAGIAQQPVEEQAATPPWQSNARADWYDAPASPEMPQEQFFSDSEDADFFGSPDESDSCPGRFLLNAALSAIEYTSPDDVVELHQSINLAYLSPEGKGQESCKGYICCLKKTGTRQVFAALCGGKSGRTWVYLPEMQPVDDATYASAIRGAISFAEGVGFMMEPVDLRQARGQRDEAVMRCPVLKIR